MDSSEIYERVRDRGALSSTEEAETAVRDVLASIVPLLDYDELAELTAQLPRDLTAGRGRSRGVPDDLIDREIFIGRLVNSIDTEYGADLALGGLDLSATYADDDALKRIWPVFATLRELLTEDTAAAIRARLPEEVRDWWDRS